MLVLPYAASPYMEAVGNIDMFSRTSAMSQLCTVFHLIPVLIQLFLKVAGPYKRDELNVFT